MKQEHETPKRTIRYPLQARVLTVSQVLHLSERMRRIVFTCDHLDSFRTSAPTDYVKLFLSRDDSGNPIMPEFGPDGIVPSSVGIEKPLSRDFSVRAFCPEDRTVTIDFFLHGIGPASDWARQAVPGQRIGMAGPRGSHVVADTFDWYLIAGDETALPAIGRWLEEARPNQRIYALVEIDDASDEQELFSQANVTIAWVHRNGAEAGTTTLLESAIRDLELVPEGGFAWVAGEATTLKSIRRYLRDELGMSQDTVDVDGYWRRGTANFDHHTPIEEDGPAP